MFLLSRRLVPLLLSFVLLLAAPPAMSTSSLRHALDETAASQFADLALACVHQEYPNQIKHLMASDADLAPPRTLTPAFYGCFDWHSSVHGHWLLVRLLREFPDAEFAPAARAALARNLTAENLAAEAHYMGHPDRKAFERPYGLAWLLQLASELDEWEDDLQAAQWRSWLRPLEEIAVANLLDWLPRLHYPIRIGEHDQTAFAFGLILDHARQTKQTVLEEALLDAARRFYLNDRNCPTHYEPSGHDFLSPCLAEADFMRRVLEPAEFSNWLSHFLPNIGQDDWLPVATVTDRTDGKLAHIDGLNLSRAWMLDGMASALTDDDARHDALIAARNQHARAGLASLGILLDEGARSSQAEETRVHYSGSHWLGSFAVYLMTERGH